MSVVKTSKTVKFKVSPATNTGKQGAFVATHALWQRAVDFYTGFFLAHVGIFETTKTVIVKKGKHKGETQEKKLDAKDLLSWAEKHTVVTDAHPRVFNDFEKTCPGMPVILRRAAINAASGAVRSNLSNEKRWMAAGCKGKGPSLPRPHPNLTMYQGVHNILVENFRDGHVRLKLFNGTKWEWYNVPVQAPPYAMSLLTGSEQEKSRIALCQKEIQQLMKASGRTEKTDEEKEVLQPAIGTWVMRACTILEKDGQWWIHIPFEKRVNIKGKAEDRRAREPNLRVGTIDLNVDSTVGISWIGHQLQGVHSFRQARENAKREKALQKVARKQSASGTAVKGEKSNRQLWRYIKNLDDSVAWQIARAIVTWAVLSGIQVLVFEHLRSYRPERGRSWSRRTNRKRNYWLRGKVMKHVRDLALREGILTVERNPAWTSQACPRCTHLAERFSPNGSGYPSRLRCEHCGWEGDANFVGAYNLKRKWNRTFRYPTAAEKKAALELRRVRKESAMQTANAMKQSDAVCIQGPEFLELVEIS